MDYFRFDKGFKFFYKDNQDSINLIQLLRHETLVMYIQKTRHLTSEEVRPIWSLIDANGQTLGRLATQIAMILRGKTKSYFSPHLDCGDFVVVTNCRHIKMSGKKWDDKFYYRHTNHIGGLKSRTAKVQFETDPCSLLYIAVKGMLPKTSLGRQQLTKLKLFSDSEHKHQAQKCVPYTLSN